MHNFILLCYCILVLVCLLAAFKLWLLPVVVVREEESVVWWCGAWWKNAATAQEILIEDPKNKCGRNRGCPIPFCFITVH